MVGKWEQQWFRVDGNVLEAFELEDNKPTTRKGQIQLGDIMDLVLEEERRECTFTATGTKVRLRGKDQLEIRAWHAALQNPVGAEPASPSRGSYVGDSPARSSRSPQRSLSSARDVWVQIDQVGNVRRATGDSKYVVTARWSGYRDDAGRTEERGSMPNVHDPSLEDCSIRQQIFLQGADEQKSVLITVNRLVDGKTVIVGKCEIPIAEPSVLKGQFYSLLDQHGRQTSSRLQVKLKVAAFPQGAAVRLLSLGQVQPVLAQTPAMDEELDAAGSPKVVSQAGAELSEEAKSDNCAQSHSTSPRRSVARCLELYALHEEQQKNLRRKRDELLSKEEEEIAEQKEKLRVGLRTVLQPADLQAVVNRLYDSARAHAQRLQDSQKKIEQEEKEKIERARAPRKVKRAASLLNYDTSSVGLRLHALHEMRLKERHEARSKAISDELTEVDKVGKAAQERLQREGVQEATKRYEELHNLAQLRAREMALKRQEALRKELEGLHKVDRSDVVGMKRIKELYDDHSTRDQRLRTLMNEQEVNMQRSLKADQDKARSMSKNAKYRKVTSVVKKHHQHVYFKPDEAIKVLEPILYEREKPHDNYELTVGLTGIILQLDKTTGDALIRWSQPPATWNGLSDRWLLKKNFNKVVIEKEKPVFVSVEDMPPPDPEKLPKPRYGKQNLEQAAFGSKIQRSVSCDVGKGTQKVHEVAEHVLLFVNATVAHRCGCHPEDCEKEALKLMEPISDLLALYRDVKKESVFNCRDGTDKLTQRDSQRLWFEGQLLNDEKGAAHCVEPDRIHQPLEDFEALMRLAEQAQSCLLTAVGPADFTVDKEALARIWPKGGRWPHPRLSKKAQFAYNPGPKTKEAAENKAFVRFGPADFDNRHRHLVDIARLSLVFPDANMLRCGLEDVIAEHTMFEVLDVRNRYHHSHQNLLGERCVEALVIMKAGCEPFICELRLEEAAYFQAREKAEPLMREIQRGFSALYESTGRDVGAIEYLVKWTLQKPVENHALKVFRRHLSQKWGSMANVWRRPLGGTKQVDFKRFRDVCQQQSQREQTVRFWQDLDAGRCGCISLFELDPDAVILLMKLYGPLLALIPGEQKVDMEAIFTNLASNISKLRTPDRLEVPEFRAAVKPLGLNVREADRLCKHLDSQGGDKNEDSLTITVQELGWLLKLPQLVHMDAVMLMKGHSHELMSSRALAWSGPIQQDMKKARVPVRTPCAGSCKTPEVEDRMLTFVTKLGDSSALNSSNNVLDCSLQAPAEGTLDAPAEAQPEATAAAEPSASLPASLAGGPPEQPPERREAEATGNSLNIGRSEEAQVVESEFEAGKEYPTQSDGVEKDENCAENMDRPDWQGETF